MATPKRARIEEMREVSPKLLLFEESCVIPQGILKAAASQMNCFRIGSPNNLFKKTLKKLIFHFFNNKYL